MPKSEKKATKETPVEEPVTEDPDAVKVQYVGTHSEVRSSISGVWGPGDVKALAPDVAEKLLATTMFEEPKGGK